MNKRAASHNSLESGTLVAPPSLPPPPKLTQSKKKRKTKTRETTVATEIVAKKLDPVQASVQAVQQAQEQAIPEMPMPMMQFPMSFPMGPFMPMQLLQHQLLQNGQNGLMPNGFNLQGLNNQEIGALFQLQGQLQGNYAGNAQSNYSGQTMQGLQQTLLPPNQLDQNLLHQILSQHEQSNSIGIDLGNPSTPAMPAPEMGGTPLSLNNVSMHEHMHLFGDTSPRVKRRREDEAEVLLNTYTNAEHLTPQPPAPTHQMPNQMPIQLPSQMPSQITAAQKDKVIAVIFMDEHNNPKINHVDPQHAIEVRVEKSASVSTSMSIHREEAETSPPLPEQGLNRKLRREKTVSVYSPAPSVRSSSSVELERRIMHPRELVRNRLSDPRPVGKKSWQSHSSVYINSKRSDISSMSSIVERLDRSFICPNCKKHFNDANLLQNHVVGHLKESSVACPVEGCERNFCSRGEVQGHLEEVHPSFMSRMEPRINVAIVPPEKMRSEVGTQTSNHRRLRTPSFDQGFRPLSRMHLAAFEYDEYPMSPSRMHSRASPVFHSAATQTVALMPSVQSVPEAIRTVGAEPMRMHQSVGVVDLPDLRTVIAAPVVESHRSVAREPVRESVREFVREPIREVSREDVSIVTMPSALVQHGSGISPGGTSLALFDSQSTKYYLLGHFPTQAQAIDVAAKELLSVAQISAHNHLGQASSRGEQMQLLQHILARKISELKV
jgi:hypothetical protein